jgi:hypothetical protein
MKRLFIVSIISVIVATCNNSVDSDRATTDSSIMTGDTTSKMKTDTGSRMMTDTSKTSGDTVVKK